MKKRNAAIAIVAITCGIVAVPSLASASNGHAWLLGKGNSETATTTVTNSKGTPLSLKAKSGTAPLAVNSGTKVTNLNADKVDGYDASSFAVRGGKTGTIVHDGTVDGTGVKCPTGTVFVSGGGYAKFGSAIYYSGPDWNVDTHEIIPNSWIVMDDSGVGVSNVTCYSPSGAKIDGAATTIEELAGDAAAAQNAKGVDASRFPSELGSAKVNDFKSAQAQPKR